MRLAGVFAGGDPHQEGGKAARGKAAFRRREEGRA
jgi:hypothetical protein